jgi:transcriptional regulator with XRE-family HTH domain
MYNLQAGSVVMPQRPGSPGAIDQCVGARIRACRETMGLTPEAFAERLGCEPDLILRYEDGQARVGAMALMMLTRVCGVEVSYFLSDLKSR